MKVLVVVLVVLAALLVGADRLALHLAEGQLAQQARTSGGLSREPDVTVAGFPFLTQAVRGRYDDVRLHTSGTVRGTPVQRLDVRLRGVRLPLSQALSGDVARVPVRSLSGDVVLPYGYLSEQAGHGLTVSDDGDRLRVRGQVDVLGQTLTASASSTLRLQDGRIVVRAQDFDAGGRTVDRLLRSLLADRFDFRVAVPVLPYGLHLTALHPTPAGLALTASSGPTVLTG